MKKQGILLIAAAVILAGGLLAGTWAYFHDEDSTTHTFTMGKVKISLDEPGWSALEPEEKILVPAREITKDPTITVEGGSEEAYIRADVVLPGEFADLLEPLTPGTGWSRGEDGYYYLADTVKKQEADSVLEPIFECMTVRGELTQDALTDVSASDLEIVIIAYAIQAEGFSDADAAWRAFSSD